MCMQRYHFSIDMHNKQMPLDFFIFSGPCFGLGVFFMFVCFIICSIT